MVRVTHSFQDASGVVALWADRCEKLLCYEHVGDVTEKIHIHLTIIGSNICKKQLRNIGDVMIPLVGNKYCSFKKFDLNETTYVYMTKGRLDPKFNKGYTQEQTDLYKSLWKDKESRLETFYGNIFDDGDEDAIDYEYWVRDNNSPEGQSPAALAAWRNKMAHGRFYWAKKTVHQWVFQHYKYIWCPAAANDYKALVYTYIFRHHVLIPDDDPFFKRVV